MKIVIFFFLCIALCFTIFTISRHVSEKPLPTVRIDGKVFYVDIAQSPLQQQKGLAIYSSLLQNHGMYFLFPRSDYYTFWMKDMKFPIDIIFIRNNRITSIFANVPAPKNVYTQLPLYKPLQPADAVLEINAGLSRKYGFKINDAIQLSNSY